MERALGALHPFLGTQKEGPRSLRSFTHHLIHSVTPLLVKFPSGAHCGYWTHKTKSNCISPFGVHSPEAKISRTRNGMMSCNVRSTHSFTDHPPCGGCCSRLRDCAFRGCLGSSRKGGASNSSPRSLPCLPPRHPVKGGNPVVRMLFCPYHQ